MAKRRLEDNDFANVLRQKHRVDPVLKQQVAQNTFARLMKAQQSQTPKKSNEPSYKYFNEENNGSAQSIQSVAKCHRCNNSSVYDKCTFCEFVMCQSCLQQCSTCQYIYCSTCSVLDYSSSSDQVFCISCLQN